MARSNSHKKNGPRWKEKKGERKKLLAALREFGIQVSDPRDTPLWRLRSILNMAQEGGHDG